MSVHVITVGDELLIGQVANTNATWLGERLTSFGLPVSEVRVIPDDRDAIRRSIEQSAGAASVVVVTGGLGPTHDDVTREAVADACGAVLNFDGGWYDVIRRRFEERGRSMPESNRGQAMVPDGFEIMPNPIGTAPGLWAARRFGQRDIDLAVLPGVPAEMKRMVENELLPRLDRRRAGARAVAHVGMTGIGESHLQELLGEIRDRMANDVALAYLPSLTGMRLRVTATGEFEDAVRRRVDEIVDYITDRAGRFVYTTAGETIEAVVGRLLVGSTLTVATAESCTGGRVADRLTDVPGSSSYFLGSVVSYSNEVKVGLLGVDSAVLRREGAVSETVALEMAAGVRSRLGADLGLASTGIMGPEGGTPDKPVGTLWVAVADGTGAVARTARLGLDRDENKTRASTAAIDLLRLRLLGRI